MIELFTTSAFGRFLRRCARLARRFGVTVVEDVGLKGCQQFVGYEVTAGASSPPAGDLLFIGPSIITIPPSGWGAVETVLHEQIRHLSGTWNCTLLNARSVFLWIRAFRRKPDAIFVHYETFLRRAVLFKRIFSRDSFIFWTSHYGYLGHPDLWEIDFKRTFIRLSRLSRQIDYFVALSPQIKSAVGGVLECRILQIPNGSNFSPATQRHPSGEVAVVGKVEIRKRQFEIAQLDFDSAVNFYGAIHDSRISQEFLKKLTQPHVFHGEVDRKRLAISLPSNSVLLHLSLAEADALVLYEAQLAGLAVVVTESSLGSQDRTLPWVYVMPDNWSFEEVKKAVDDARIYVRDNRTRIIAHAEANYRWQHQLKPLVSELKRILAK